MAAVPPGTAFENPARHPKTSPSDNHVLEGFSRRAAELRSASGWSRPTGWARYPYALAAYAYTESAERALLIGDALEAGMVGINTERLGAEDGPEGVEACLVTKAIHQA